MTLRHCLYDVLCFSTGSELDDHAATAHETRLHRPELAEVGSAGAVAER